MSIVPPAPRPSSALLSPVVVLLLVAGFTAAPAAAWETRVARPPGAQPNIARSLAVDGDGNVILAGEIRVSDGAGGFKSALGAVKLSGIDGSEIWRATVDSGPRGAGRAKADPNGDVIVAGFVANNDARQTSDFLAVKLAKATGQVLWSRRINGTADDFDEANALAIDALGDVALTGSIRNATGPASAMLVVKLDGDTGGEVFRREITSGDILDDDETGNIGRAVAFDANGNVIAVGSVTIFPFDGHALVVKFSASGTELWRQTELPSLGGAVVNDLALDGAGNAVVVGGLLNASKTFFYAKVAGNDGEVLWSKEFSEPTGTALGVAIDTAGHAYVAGEYRFPNPDNPPFPIERFVVVKIDSASGTPLWTYEAPSKGVAGSAVDVLLDLDGNVVATGATSVSKKGFSVDLQVVKLAPTTGTAIYRRTFPVSEAVALALDQENHVVTAGLGSEVLEIAPPAFGKTLAFKDPAGKPEKRKLKVQVKDKSFVPSLPGSTGDPTITGATLLVRNPTTNEQTTVALGAGTWEGVGKPPGVKGYAYKLKGDPCTVTMKSGEWKAACAGAGIGFTLDEAAQGSLFVRLTLGTERSCSLFGGEVSKDVPIAGKKSGEFKAKNAPAPASCN